MRTWTYGAPSTAYRRELEDVKSVELQPEAAAAVIATLREIDGVLKVIF